MGIATQVYAYVDKTHNKDKKKPFTGLFAAYTRESTPVQSMISKAFRVKRFSNHEPKSVDFPAK